MKNKLHVIMFPVMEIRRNEKCNHCDKLMAKYTIKISCDNYYKNEAILGFY